MLPKFTPKLKAILEDGKKKEMAAVADSIAKEIVKDMYAREGSGSVKYYNQLERELIKEYPNMNSGLFRNALRREMDKDIPLSKLSEGSQEDDELKPTPDSKRRTFTTKKSKLV